MDTKTKGARAITSTQLRMLRNIADGRGWDADLSGRSQYGGATATKQSLHKRGLLQNGQLTDAGRDALAGRAA